METIKDVIQALGGAPPVAKAASVDRSTPNHWIGRNRIPLDYWDAIIALSVEVGVTGLDRDLLARLCARKRPVPVVCEGA